jgi:hypothetical protein
METIGHISQIFFRVSEAGNVKPKLGSKEICLRNLLSCFGAINTRLVCDNISDEFYEVLKAIVVGKPIRFSRTSLGNCGSFRFVMQSVLDTLSDDKIVYLVEDDYLHLDRSKEVIEEGFSTFPQVDYISLYDHPDKYSPMYDLGEIAKVITSKSTHWKCTISTTFTFAARVKALREDREIWDIFTQNNQVPDHLIFTCLRQKGRALITPIPGLSTHTDEANLCPFVNWDAVAKKYE